MVAVTIVLQAMTSVILYYLAVVFFVLSMKGMLEWWSIYPPDPPREWRIVRRVVIYLMLVPLLILVANTLHTGALGL